jgi:Mrp family chromosome partitioning ATPase
MVEIQDNMPPDPQKTDAEKDAAVKKSLDRIKNKIIVMSGKGGVGKTSTSVNLSIALAGSGYQVGIMEICMVRMSRGCSE